MILKRKKTEGNYEKKKKNLPLLLAVIALGIVFFIFLFFHSASDKRSAKDLVAFAGADRESEGSSPKDPASSKGEGLAFAPLTEETGTPLYDDAGNPLYADENGNVFTCGEKGDRFLYDWEGRPIYDSEGYRLCVDSYGNYYVSAQNGLKELRDEYGSVVFDAKGRKLFLDDYGNAYVLSEGDRVLVAGDGTPITDLEGNEIHLLGTAKDEVYATKESVRGEMKLAADAVHETIYGTSADAAAAYKTALHQAALSARNALHGAADATGDALRASPGTVGAFAKDTLQGAAEGAGEVLDSAGNAAVNTGNMWYSFLVNDWEKLKKDLVTPTEAFSGGNSPNALEDTEHELFPRGD